MKKKLSVLKIHLAAACLALSSCGGLPKAPETTIKQPLFNKNVTREFEVEDPDQLTFKFKKEWPLDYANGMFCITNLEFQAWRSWYFNVKENYQCKPKKGKNGINTDGTSEE